MMKDFYRVESVEQTWEIAKDFAKLLKAGDVVCLEGDLGAGKTTFTQGLAAALGAKGRVASPTFCIVREHPIEEVCSLQFAVCSSEEEVCSSEEKVCSLQFAVCSDGRASNGARKDAPPQLPTANCKPQTNPQPQSQTANCKLQTNSQPQTANCKLQTNPQPQLQTANCKLQTNPQLQTANCKPQTLPQLLVHMDLYRLNGEDDVEAIGWDDYLAKGAVIVVEWPERAGSLIPKNAYRIAFKHCGDDGDGETREIFFS